MPASTQKRHPIKRLLLIAAVLTVAALAYLWPALRTVAPLVRATGFAAVCRTSDGSLLPVTVYRGLGLPDRVFLFIPAEERYRWFTVDFRYSLVAAHNRPRTTFGITYARTDQSVGIDLLDLKIEDTWEVAFHPRLVNFKNRRLDISLESIGGA